MTTKSKVSVCFVVPITTAANGKEVRAAYAELRRQIVQFANAITRDPNVIITHAAVTPDPSDLGTAIKLPADSKIAEIQSIAVPKAPETPATSKKDREIPAPPEEDEEKPHIQINQWTPPQPSAPKAVEVPSTATLDKIFENLKRTEKSLIVVKFLITQAGKELTVDDIVTGTKLDKTQVASWLAATSESIAGLEKVKRGVYKLTV